MKTLKSELALATLFFSFAFLLASCSLGSASITTTRKALLIGINIYPSSPDLTYPVADAEAMQTLLYAQDGKPRR